MRLIGIIATSKAYVNIIAQVFSFSCLCGNFIHLMIQGSKCQKTLVLAQKGS
jgi:hypothetical protein